MRTGQALSSPVRELAGNHTSIGHLHSSVTYILGLKPHEHEYRAMGLAPYVGARYGREVREILSRYVYLDESGLGFSRSSAPWAHLHERRLPAP